MEEFKGTPGPWYQDQFGNVIHGERKEKVRVSGVALPGRVTEEYAANTNLVTAAPELLEALQDFMAEPSCKPKSCGHELWCSCRFDKARAAIAKALGK